jgi:hypothetical protein
MIWFPPSFGSFGLTVSEEKNFKNQPFRNKNRLWRPCLLMDRDKLSNLYRRPPIDDTYQVSVHLAKGFQRRRLKCEKLTDARQTTDAKWWQKLTLPLARWANNMKTRRTVLIVYGENGVTEGQCLSWERCNRRTALIMRTV